MLESYLQGTFLVRQRRKKFRPLSVLTLTLFVSSFQNTKDLLSARKLPERSCSFYFTRANEAQSNIQFKLSKKAYSSNTCLLYTSPSPRDGLLSRMPSSA
eukprot:TRINITY_DN10621_c0_g1_i1.p3 TRINITY_DN10621_c0_g1~~TRINITY_DN10621_c0_g1_i1.p3  ORF type:complete len:100 (-),score=2.06 TRINITY_DN10621_c0_g1_i1:10-309(-)